LCKYVSALPNVVPGAVLGKVFSSHSWSCCRTGNALC
jgi:hypothetical protein